MDDRLSQLLKAAIQRTQRLDAAVSNIQEELTTSRKRESELELELVARKAANEAWQRADDATKGTQTEVPRGGLELDSSAFDAAIDSVIAQQESRPEHGRCVLPTAPAGLSAAPRAPQTLTAASTAPEAPPGTGRNLLGTFGTVDPEKEVRS